MWVFAKFLLIFLAVVWFVGLITRATFSRFLRRQTEAYQRAAQNARREAKRQAQGNREGNVTVETDGAAGRKKVNRAVGEYVEFEEIANSD
jgi:type II secretory pathway pseudopilin PulG